MPTPANRAYTAFMGLVFCLLAALSAVGCAGVPKEYVNADRATFEAVAPDFVEYVENDPDLSANQKRVRKSTIETWRIRIEAAERVNDDEAGQ